jgi:tetratricopeptide (TPR) repeat protein
LLTTRDTQFNDQRFAPSTQCAHVELGGLAMSDALDLAAAVLNAHGIDRTPVSRQELVDLMDRLGGHPLSLYLVLPWLRRYTPAELSARFEELLPGFQTGAAKERNESLAVSLEFSLRRLGEATRAALPDLAVFQGGAMEDDLLAITEIDPELWKDARAELAGAALLTAESLPNVAVPFLRFHPTLAPYLATRLSAARRAALEERYWQRYYALANYLYRSDTQTPHEARAIALRELPNLRRALDLCLAALSSPLRGESERQEMAGAAVGFADSIARFLDVFGRWRERDVMMANVKRQTSSVITETGGITQAEFLLLSRQGDTLRQQGRAAEAEGLFRDLLGRLEAGAAYDAAYDHAMTLARLGRCLAAQGRPAQAMEWHRRALGEFEQIGKSTKQQISKSAKEMLGKIYADLGDNLAAVGRFDEAQRAYESGLEISRAVGDHRAVGVKLGQLGTLAERRGDLAEAGRRYSEALATFRALGEPQSEAVVWHQLGMVAQKAKDWQEAERCYREAVRIREQIRDLPMLATDFNQLALVAQGAGRPADAERWYLRALEAFEQLKDPAAQAKVLSNLASLYLSQGRLEEAARHAHRAVEIDEAIGDPSVEIWKDYSILAQIAEKQGRTAEAREWRRKEQESYAAYAGAGHEMRQYQPLIQAIVAACQGSEEARQWVEGEFPKMEAGSEDWARAATSIRRVLAGERDADALTANLSVQPMLVVRAILAQLAGERASPPGPLSRGTGEGETPTPTPPPQGEEGGPTSPPLAGEGPGERAALAALLQQWAPVIAAVVAACRGNRDAAAQLQPLLGELAQQDDWRALSAVLRRILNGERDPNALLPGLDATDMLLVAAVLQTLGGPPGEAPS